MRDFNPSPEVRPEAFQFAGAANGGSFVRPMPRSPFSGAAELEFASELLQVTSEAELDRFLGDLFKKVWSGIGPAEWKVIGPLKGLLKSVAMKALPSLAAATGASSVGPAGGAIVEKLGSIVGQALEAETAGMAAADHDLQRCRQLFEKHRQFVRLAGKAVKAAASAPTGSAAVDVAQKILMDSAKEKLTRKAAAARVAGKLAEGALAAPAMKGAVTAGLTRKLPEWALAAPAMTTAAAARRAVAKKTRTETQAPGGPTCTICELPPGACQCRKIGRSGRWFRRGSSIIVNC